MLKPYLITCAAMSVIAFIFFAWDKANAADGRSFRVPEIVLLTLATLGGGVGAFLGRVLLHHKSSARKWHFAVVIIASAILQFAFAGYLVFAEQLLYFYA